MNSCLLKRRLTNLQRDIAFASAFLGEKISMYNEMKESLEKLKEDYVREFAPVASSNLEIKPQADRDMNEFFINFSEGYDNFKNTLAKQKVYYEYKRDSSIFLLNCILKMPSPYNEILFLKYFMNVTPESIEKLYYFSRTSFYRSLNKGIDELFEYLKENDVYGFFSGNQYDEFDDLSDFYDDDGCLF